MKTFWSCFLVFLVCTPAAAHEVPITYDRINLSVTEQADVDNDVLVAVMFYQREGQRAAAVSNEVNKNVSWALAKARAVAAVKSQTLQYTTSPVYRNQVVTGWRVRQGVRLESRDVGALGELIATLLERLAVQSVDYTISPERRAEAEEGLVRRALAAFRRRAQLITGELGRDHYNIVHLNVATQGARPSPIAFRGAMMAESAGVAAPALEVGMQKVQVIVSGTIELKPQQAP